MEKKRVLLHVCCAACSVHVAELLSREYDIALYFNNPQIFPATEHAKRLIEAKKVGKMLGLEVIEGNRDRDSWVLYIEGLEQEPEGGKRCAKCFEFNLEDTAKFAKHEGFDAFTTTLTVSPHKNAEMINKIGKIIGEKHGIEFLEQDFKKDGGFLESCKKCHEHDIYRQDYCGCEFSLNKSIASPKE